MEIIEGASYMETCFRECLPLTLDPNTGGGREEGSDPADLVTSRTRRGLLPFCQFPVVTLGPTGAQAFPPFLTLAVVRVSLTGWDRAWSPSDMIPTETGL